MPVRKFLKSFRSLLSLSFKGDHWRFTVICTAIIAIMMVAVGGVVSIVINDHDYRTTPVITSVIGFTGLAVNQLLSMARAEQSRTVLHRKLDETLCLVREKQAPVTDERLIEVTKTAERQVLEESTLPRTRNELQLLIHNELVTSLRPLIAEIIQECMHLHEQSMHGDRR